MMHSTQLSCVRAVLLFWHSQISGFEGIGKHFDSRLFYTTNNISYFTTSLSENITSLSDLHFLNNIGIYCVGESNRKCCYLIIADFFVRLLKQPQGNQRAADCRKVRGSRLRPNMLVLHRGVSQVSCCLPPAERHVEGKDVREGSHTVAFQRWCPQSLCSKSWLLINSVQTNLLFTSPVF